MTGKDVFALFKDLSKRVVFLYVLLAAAFFLLTDHKAILRMGELKALSRATPSFDYGQGVLGRGKAPSPRALAECRYYHRQIADVVPLSAGEAWGVAAFCGYGLSQEADAISSLEKSLKKTPVFFWTQYNLGIARMNQGDYQKAGDAFLMALRLDPKYTLMILRSSKVYKDIFYSMHESYDPESGLKEGYQQAGAYFQMALTCFRAPQTSSCQNRGRLPMRLF